MKIRGRRRYLRLVVTETKLSPDRQGAVITLRDEQFDDDTLTIATGWRRALEEFQPGEVYEIEMVRIPNTDLKE